MARFSVAIVGAGMGGLVLAIALQKYAEDVEFTIYESAAQMSEIGAGIVMHERTWKIMEALGLDESLLKVAGDGERPAVVVMYRKSDQAEGVDLNVIRRSDGSFTFHRGELQNVLLQHLQPSHQVVLSKRLVSYTQSHEDTSPIELLFQDGTTAKCDVLIGSDGIRSAVRASMYTELAAIATSDGRSAEAEQLLSHVSPVFSGVIAYRTLIPKESLPAEFAARDAFNKSGLMFYCGKNKHLVTYLISQGRILNVAVVIYEPELEGTIYPGPWTSDVGREEFAECFSGWEPEVQDIIANTTGGLKWALNNVTKLPTYVHGRVLLLGDAAHAMEPHQGAGAGQGFEDAFFLGQCLGHPSITRETVSVALKLHDEFRRPMSQKVAEWSHMSGLIHSLATPELRNLTEEQSASGTALTLEQLHKLGDEMEELRRWRLIMPIMEENEAALRRLDERLRDVVKK